MCVLSMWVFMNTCLKKSAVLWTQSLLWTEELKLPDFLHSPLLSLSSSSSSSFSSSSSSSPSSSSSFSSFLLFSFNSLFVLLYDYCFSRFCTSHSPQFIWAYRDKLTNLSIPILNSQQIQCTHLKLSFLSRSNRPWLCVQTVVHVETKTTTNCANCYWMCDGVN